MCQSWWRRIMPVSTGKVAARLRILRSDGSLSASSVRSPLAWQTDSVSLWGALRRSTIVVSPRNALLPVASCCSSSGRIAYPYLGEAQVTTGRCDLITGCRGYAGTSTAPMADPILADDTLPAMPDRPRYYGRPPSDGGSRAGGSHATGVKSSMNRPVSTVPAPGTPSATRSATRGCPPSDRLYSVGRRARQAISCNAGRSEAAWLSVTALARRRKRASRRD